MSRRTEKRRYGKYNKFDVVYADFGKNPHGIQGGIRPGIIISCDASNHDGAPQVSVVPLSSKLKDIPVHVILNPKDVSGFGLSKISDFMPEDAQTISKGCIRAKSGTIIEDSGVREEIDRALIRQFAQALCSTQGSREVRRAYVHGCDGRGGCETHFGHIASAKCSGYRCEQGGSHHATVPDTESQACRRTRHPAT